MTEVTGRDDAVSAQADGLDLRSLLRKETSDAHHRLDSGWAGHDLKDCDAYGAFLGAMAVVLVPLEADLALVVPEALPPDWPMRRRTAAILADLAALGRRVPVVDVTPRAPMPAEAAGLLYVLEGSRLGGQLLLRQVLGSSDAKVRENTCFLRHGEGQSLWPSFAAWLKARPASDARGAVAGALRAFSLFEAAQSARI